MNKLREIQEFARYEFKYIITNATSNAIEAEVKNFMQSDNYASQKIDNAYYVRSQYYDNDLSSHFYENPSIFLFSFLPTPLHGDHSTLKIH